MKLFQAKALYKLASPSTPEPAREEALSLAESGERITHAKVQEIIAEHKAEAEAAKQESKRKQGLIETLEEKLLSLEQQRRQLALERDQLRHTKSADDACIIRQDALVDKLNAQIAEPQVKRKQKFTTQVSGLLVQWRKMQVDCRG